MKTYIKENLKRTYLVLVGEEKEEEDYQILMLKENEIPGILKTDIRYVDNQSYYYYDISGKVSLKMVYEKDQLSYTEMKNIVWGLLATIQNLKKYMLDENRILLDPELIFTDKEKYFFCYYPPCEQEAKEEFHKLTEFFVKEVNYDDEEGVRFAYMFHKSTMEENYSIEEIMKTFPEEEEKPPLEETLDVTFVECQDVEEESEEQEKREMRDFWEKPRNLFKKVKSWCAGDEYEDL